MTVSKELIQNVKDLKTSLNEISVYDLDVYTSMELYYKIANKLNEVIKELSRFEGVVSDEVIKQNEKLQYLLGEGLKTEVIKKIDQMVTDGTMDTIINHKIFNDLNTKIDTFKQEVSEQFNTKVSQEGHYNHRGTKPFLEVASLEGNIIFHILAGEGCTSPYLIGVGVDHGSTTGLLTSVKDSGIGMGSTLESTSTENAKGFFGQVFGSGKLIDLVQGTGSGKPMVNLRNPYGGSRDMQFLEGVNWKQRVTSDGYVEKWFGDDNLPNTMYIEQITGSNIFKYYLTKANSTQMFGKRIVVNSNSMKIQGAILTGKEYLNATWTTIFELKDDNAIGFYGVTPVTRQQIITPDVNNVFNALKNLGLLAQ